MTLAQYEMLMAVVDNGSLTKAAEGLGCTQSAVSHGIDALEKELGFALITRSRAGGAPDGGGGAAPARREEPSQQRRAAQPDCRLHTGLDSGTVRIGAFTSVAVHWLPAVLKSFQHDYPKVEFILKNGDYHDVEQWIRDGSIDVGFVTVPSALGCECIPLKEDRLLAILPRGSRFAKLPQVPDSRMRDGAVHKPA